MEVATEVLTRKEKKGTWKLGKRKVADWSTKSRQRAIVRKIGKRREVRKKT